MKKKPCLCRLCGLPPWFKATAEDILAVFNQAVGWPY